MIKVFGIGNILLCDDGVGVKVVENLSEKIMSIDNNMEVIVGETDYLYCLDKINDDDTVIIVDSTYFMIRPGTVTTRTLEQCDEFLQEKSTSHNESLIDILRRERREVKGYLIGIEVDKIQYSMNLSKILNRKLNSIYNNVYDQIETIISEISRV